MPHTNKGLCDISKNETVHQEQAPIKQHRGGDATQGKQRESPHPGTGGRQLDAFRGVGMRKQRGAFEIRQSHGASGEQFQVGEFQLVQQIVVPGVAILAGKAHGQAQIVDLTHVQLMGADGIEPFKENLAGIRGIVVAPLQGLPQPLIFAGPIGEQNRLVDPGEHGETGHIVIRGGNILLLGAGFALGDQTPDVRIHLLEGCPSSGLPGDHGRIGHQFNETIGKTHD
ncbi:hypothetical protein DESC_160008 [Desulfosarcina cetonica]|nr:hypothetical protein DESC_160008 [Desulfosarcina cetonica]